MRWTKVAGYSAVNPKILSWGERKSWLELFMTSWFHYVFRLSSHRRCNTTALWLCPLGKYLSNVPEYEFLFFKKLSSIDTSTKCCQPVRNMHSSSKYSWIWISLLQKALFHIRLIGNVVNLFVTCTVHQKSLRVNSTESMKAMKLCLLSYLISSNHF